MIEFLKEYWFEVSSILVSVITFIVLLCKKKIKFSDTALSQVLLKLPEFIIDAEKSFTDGRAKKLYVVNAAIKYYQEIGGNPSRDISNVIVEEVENILSTPKKKEENNEN